MFFFDIQIKVIVKISNGICCGIFDNDRNFNQRFFIFIGYVVSYIELSYCCCCSEQ